MRSSILIPALLLAASLAIAATRSLTFAAPVAVESVCVEPTSSGWTVTVRACGDSGTDLADCATVTRTLPAGDPRAAGLASWGLAQWKSAKGY